MKSIQVTRYGGSEVLALADVEVPEPGNGEVLVKLDFSGVNFIDIYTRKGDYAKSDTYANRPPFTLGREGAGTVAKLGPGVGELAEDCGIPDNVASEHLRLMQRCGLFASERQGRRE